jgi:hypothetical protein
MVAQEKSLGTTAHVDSSVQFSSLKVKAVPLHAMEAHGGKGGIVPTHT